MLRVDSGRVLFLCSLFVDLNFGRIFDEVFLAFGRTFWRRHGIY